MSAFDPGCVKTHTSTKCGKYNSPTGHRAVCVQYDLTLMMRNLSEMFYARGGRWSFYTTKTLTGHSQIRSIAPSAQNAVPREHESERHVPARRHDHLH
jgi:hypothetical protein